ncbi:MAG: CoA transferase [Gammaproteobacteria bacterium]|nr:CoA transferase [Gammaproteobacteria bacterium]
MLNVAATASSLLAPLSGLRVLDLSEGIAAPFCAKLLGDLGADVIKLESAAGDCMRRFGPFPQGQLDPERSASFFFLNTSKRSVVIDVSTPGGQARLRSLVASYDVIIAGETAGSLADRGIGIDVLRSWNPAVIVSTVSGFGSWGPYAGFTWSHLVAGALGGWAHLCGLPEREPLQAGGALAETLTGAFAAVGTLLAVLGRHRHGGGEHVDVSAQQAVLLAAQIPTLRYEYTGVVPPRNSSVGSGAGAGFMLPTRDGYIGLNALTRAQWGMLCEFLGRGEIAVDPRYAHISWVNPDDALEEVRALFRAAVVDRSATELFHAAEAKRVPFGLIPDLAGLFALTPHRERGWFVEVNHPVAGQVKVPGVPFKSTVTSPRPGPPPLLGQHTHEVLAGLSAAASAAEVVRTALSDDLNPLPLAGLRILDLSMFFAGPVCAQIAADAGADVIKVESIQRIDGWRGSAAVTQGSVPSWEASPYFNWVNRNKRDITLNLKDPRGCEIVKNLVRDADVLIENFTPRVMAEFGLDYAVLRAINPRLIMISLSGFGATGQWRDYVAFGMSTEQFSGLSHLTGYEQGEPLFTGTTGGDLFSGVLGALAVCSALWHRHRTGEGQHIDFSQIEACNLYLGDVMTGWSLCGVDPGRNGNTHPVFAPQGFYPCRNGGWIGITCRDQAQWENLARHMQRPDLLTSSLFVTAAARNHRRQELDALIAAWTRGQDAIELMHALQLAGVAAGAVLNGPQLLADPQLQARRAFVQQERPGLGVHHYPVQPYHFTSSEAPPNNRAPLLGEHLTEVLTERANLKDDDLVELIIDDVIGTVPVAAR